MTLDLFANIPVSDYGRALRWWGQLLGCEASFIPNDVEAVWELAEHRYLVVEVRPEQAGTAKHTVFLSDLDAMVDQINGRGLEPDGRETYGNGVRKVIYRDPDGNELGFGGAPR